MLMLLNSTEFNSPTDLYNNLDLNLSNDYQKFILNVANLLTDIIPSPFDNCSLFDHLFKNITKAKPIEFRDMVLSVFMKIHHVYSYKLTFETSSVKFNWSPTMGPLFQNIILFNQVPKLEKSGAQINQLTESQFNIISLTLLSNDQLDTFGGLNNFYIQYEQKFRLFA